MKKKVLLKLLGLIAFMFCSFNDLFPQNCDFTISPEVSNVSCPGNGSITVNITDTVGNDITGYRYSLRSSLLNIDRSTSNIFSGLSEGTYKVVVEAICGNNTISDSVSNIVVSSNYVIPDLGIVQGAFTASHQYGFVPSFACSPTGQIQLRIENGVFPYTIEIEKNGTHYRTDVFNERMYNGSSSNRYDYKDYYTISSLEPGSYTFHVTDGCGYSLPFVTGSVTSIAETYPVSVMYIYTDPGNIPDNNIFRFSLLQNIMGNNNYYYYGYTQSQGTASWWEYSLSIDGGSTFTAWKNVSANGIVQDTIASLTRYCDLTNPIQVKVRDKICGKEYTKSFSFTYPNVGAAYQYTTDSSTNTPATYDACGFTAEKKVIYQHTSTYYQQMSGYRTNQINNSSANYYFTPPLTIQVTDVASGTIMSTTTQTTPSYNWRQNINLTPDMNGKSVNIRVTDNNGCVLTNNNQVINYRDNIVSTTGGNRANTTWQINSSAQNNDNCGQTMRSISIVRQNPSPDYLDSTVIHLIQSPDNNKYNFTATYLAASSQWIITKESPTNTADITPGSSVANQLNISAVDLVSGAYVFEIKTQCRTETITKNFTFPVFLSILEYPTYNFIQNCGSMSIVPTAGQIQANGVNTTTYFSVISGEPGGYPDNAVTLNGHLDLTIHGNYTIRMYSTINNSSPCGIYDTTINYSGANIDFEYLFAYVCTPSDTVTHVNARGISGKSPYTYTLSKDAQGTVIIASDTIGDFGNISAKLGDELYLKIEDACDASFITPVNIISLESFRKAWFVNNNDKALSICQGDVAYLDGISLGDVEYSWSGPNGFSDTLQNTQRLIPRSISDEGWYYLEVNNSFCPIVKDSIYLTILEAPSVTILDNASICPTEEYVVNITAEGSGNITYTVAKEMNSIISTKTITNAVSGQMDTLIVAPLSTMKIWLQDIQDQQCAYNIPEDTITISIKSISSSCNITALEQEVCYNTTAELTANSTLDYPYTIYWYTNEDLTTQIQSDVINNASEHSVKTLPNLRNDTIFYITASNDDFCEYRPGVTVSSINMSNTTTQINCGESVRFYDSGGPNGNYKNNEDLIQTFTSTNGDPVNIKFDSFKTESANYDKMYIYDGADINAQVLASELGGDLNNNLPGPFISTGNSLTVLFVSNFNNNDEGWNAIVGVQNGPVPVIAKVLDTLSLTLTSSQQLPIHYNSSTTLTANATGGRGDSYQYTWYTSADSITWTQSPNTARTYQVSNLTTPTYYRVVVVDNSTDACAGEVESVIFLNVANITLSLDLSTATPSVCPGKVDITLTVYNNGPQIAHNVLSTIILPEKISEDGAKNLSVEFDQILPHSSRDLDIELDVEASLLINNPQIKAQIMTSSQGDSNPNIVYGNWDWEGNPSEVDEDTLTIHIKPVVTNNQILAINDTVCYGTDAVLQASSELSYPQHYYWYTDSLGNNPVFNEIIQSGTSSLTIANLTENTKRFVSMTNDSICPYTILEKEYNELVAMTNGISDVEINEIITIVDSESPGGHYSQNENFTYTFVSPSGDPIIIKFNNFYTDPEAGDYFYLYDGNSTTAPLLTPSLSGDLSSQMPLTFITTGNSLTISFQSSSIEGFVNWNADISTVQQLKQVNAYIKDFADPATITTTPDSVCPGNTATLEAISTIDYPQTFNWYSDVNLTNLVYQEIVDGAVRNKSVFTPQLQSSDSTYYITVGNDELCNLSNEGLATSAYRPVSVTAKVNPLPDVEITGDQTVCVMETLQLTGSPEDGTWSSLNTTIASVNSSGIVTAITPGTAAIKYVVTNSSGCTDSASINITVNPLPSITVNDISICSGSNANLTTAVSSIAGTTPLFFTDVNATISVTNPSSYSGVLTNTTFYVKNVYDNSGCESELMSFNVRVNPVPTVSVQNISICSGTNANLNNAITSVVGDTLLFYSDAQGTIPVIDPTNVNVSANPTTFYVKALNISTDCESNLVQFNISLNAAPSITLLSDNSPVCKGQLTNIRYTINNATGATVSGLPDGVNYSLSGRTLTISGVSLIYGTFNYTITTTGQNSTCSPDTIIESFTVNPNPVAQFNYTVDPVTPLNVTFADQSTITSGSIVDWHWDFGDNNATSDVQNPPTYTFTSSGYYNVNLRVTSDQGCTSNITNQIHTNATINAGFDIDNVIECYTGSNIVNFHNTTTVTGTSTDPVYTWNFGDNTPTTNEVSPSHVYTQPGTYTVKLSVSVAGNSTQIISRVVIILPTPPLTVHDIQICNGEIADLRTAVNNVAGTIMAFYSDLSGSPALINPESISNILQDSTFYAKLIYPTTGCESDLVPFDVIVNEIPSVTTELINVCTNAVSFDLNSSIVYQTPGTTLKFYKDPAGNIPVLSPETITQIAILPYYVKAVNETTGCESPLEFIPILVYTLPTIDVQNISICEGEVVDLLTATSNLHGDNIIFYSDASATDTVSNIINNLNTTTTYYAQAFASVSGCYGDIKSFNVVVNQLPDISIIGNTDVCEGKTTQLTVTPEGGNWISLNTSIATIDNTGLVTGITDGNANIRYIVANIHGCIDSTDISISVHSLPIVYIEEAPELTICNETTRALTISTTGRIIRWNNSNPDVATVNLNGIVRTLSPGTTELYCVAENENGCIDSAMIKITVNSLPSVSAKNLVYCNGEEVSGYSFKVDLSDNNTYSWRRVLGHDFGLNSISGLDIIPGFTAENTGIYPLEAIYEVTPIFTENGATCIGISEDFLITVNPTPTLAPVIDMVHCYGSTVDPYIFTGNVPDAEYKWWRTDGDAISEIPEYGENFMPGFIAMTNESILTANYKLTADYNFANKTCNNGDTIEFSISILPDIIVNIENVDQTICSGSAINTISFTSNTDPSMITYEWERIAGYVPELSASGSGNINSLTLTNIGTTPTTALYEVTPKFNYNGLICEGTPKTFSITVIPEVEIDTLLTMEFCAGESISSYSFGNDPNVRYSWLNETNVNIGLPDSGNGSLPAFTAIRDNATTLSTTYKVTAYRTVNNETCSNDMTLAITVNPTPIVEVSDSYTICNNNNLLIEFTGTADNYNWEKISGDNIGLPYSGTGDINSIVTNNGTTSATATYEVTPVFNYNGSVCNGNSKTFSITVIPGIEIDTLLTMEFCAGESISSYSFGNDPNIRYSWVNQTDVNIGLPDSGNGPLPAFTAINNNSSAPSTAIYKVTAYRTVNNETCSNDMTLTITVNPFPNVEVADSYTVCNNNSLSIEFSGNATNYYWEKMSGDNIGLPYSGNGDIIDHIFVNNTNSQISATYKVVPQSGTCSGSVEIFDIIVYPSPILSSLTEGDIICSGSVYEYIATSNTSNVTFSWSREANSDINNGNTSSGTNAEIREILTSTSPNPVEVIYNINMNTSNCGQYSQQVKVVVNPNPVINMDNLFTICSGTSSIEILYTTTRTVQMEYAVTFALSSRIAGFVEQTEFIDLPIEEITIPVPQNIHPGSYPGTIIVRYGLCETEYPFEINVLNVFTITQQPESQLYLCDDGSEFDLTVLTDTEGLMYQWYHNGLIVTGATSNKYSEIYDENMDGEYYVKVSNGCDTLTSNTVIIRKNPVFIREKWGNVLLVDDPNHEFSAFQWYKNNIAVNVNGTSQYYAEESGFNGIYHIRCYYQDGSYIESCPVEFISERNSIFSMYPNPAKHGSSVFIELDSNETDINGTSIELFDQVGKLIENKYAVDYKTEIKAPLMPGTYVVRITTTSGNIIIKQLIIN